MAGAINELVKSLMGTRDGVLPSIQAFPPLDIDQIANKLHLEKIGKENGGLDQPATDSTIEDIVEGDILDEIDRRTRKAGEEFNSQLNLYDGRIRHALISTDQGAMINAAGENALTDFKVQASDDLDHLHSVRIEVEGRIRDFNLFRAEHKIKRLPNIISRRERTVRLLVLAILVVVESTINGLFFAEGSETGLIGGITQALVLSLLNVGTAVLYARYSLPLVRHVRPSVRIIGMLFTLLFLFWMFGLNLSIGHFRDLFIQYAGQVKASDLILRLTTSLFVFADAQSMILVLLGIFMSLVSMIDAMGLDDNYPGYGVIGRLRENAISFYAEKKAKCLAGLTQRRDLAIDDMSSVIKDIRNAEHDLQLAVDGRTRLHKNYCAYLDHLSERYQRLLQRYRESNLRSRSTPPPTRFQIRPATPALLSKPSLPDLVDLNMDVRSDLIERMKHYITAINQQFETVVQQFPTIDSLADQREDRHVNA